VWGVGDVVRLLLGGKGSGPRRRGENWGGSGG